MEELITIGIPVYNMEKSIKSCIESCLRQTYSNFEILCVDDGSTDNSADKIKEINDPRIRLFQREKNGGVCAAMNSILEQAKGIYLAILDADDTMMPTRLEEQYKAIKKGEKKYPERMSASFCGSQVVETNLVKNRTRTYQIMPKHLFRGKFGGGTGHSMYKVADIKKLGGFDIRFSRSSDSALCLDFLAENGFYAFVNKPLITYNFLWDESKETTSLLDTDAFTSKLVEKYNTYNPLKLCKYNRAVLDFLFDRKISYKGRILYKSKKADGSFIQDYLSLCQKRKALLPGLYLHACWRFFKAVRRNLRKYK